MQSSQRSQYEIMDNGYPGYFGYIFRINNRIYHFFALNLKLIHYITEFIMIYSV